MPADAAGNVSQGQHLAVETHGCIIFSDAGKVGTLGLRDMVVVYANGRVLVCPKNRASDLKRLVAELPREA